MQAEPRSSNAEQGYGYSLYQNKVCEDYKKVVGDYYSDPWRFNLGTKRWGKTVGEVWGIRPRLYELSLLKKKTGAATGHLRT